MKNLIIIVKLLLSSFVYLISSKLKSKGFLSTLFLSFILIPLSLQAVTLNPAATCPGANYNVLDGVNTIDGDTVGGANYYELSIPSAGDLTITLTTAGNKPATFFIGTSCDAIDIYNGSSDSSLHTSTFSLTSSDIIYLKISNTNSNEAFSITINFTPDTTNADPTFTSTPITTATEATLYSYVVTTDDTDGDTVTVSADLSLATWLSFDGTTLSGTPVTADVGTHTVILTADDGRGGTAEQSFDIVVSGLVSNAPEVSISPNTISIPEGANTVDLQIILNEAATTGDLNVSYTNSDTNTTGYLIVPQGSTSVSLSIDTTGLTQGTEFNITLTGATGLLTQNDGTLSSSNYFSTITIDAPESDLSIAKIDSEDPVVANASFYYTITVYNGGSAPATGITVTDTLPAGLTVNLASTNVDSPDWNCTQSADIVTCTHDGNISVIEQKDITLHVTAPSIAQTITNTVSVSSDNDYDLNNNQATETTRIISGTYQEIDEANQLCYRDTTDVNDVTIGPNCIKVGNFYYGEGCDATILIKSDANLTTTLTDVNVTVMIAVSNDKDLDDGSCTSTQGNCTGPNPLYLTEHPSYLEGYMVPDVGTMLSDANFTIGHSNTYNGKPLYQIAMYATYNYDGVYHFGRVYSCDGLSEGGIQAIASADTVDTPIDSANAAAYNASSDTSSNGLKYLQTMVAADNTRAISAVHLNINTKEAEVYIEPSGYTPGSLPFVIIPKLVHTGPNGECDSNSFIEDMHAADGTSELLIPIASGTYSNSAVMTVPATVQKDVKLQLIIVDPRLLSDDGKDCLATSSTTGNLGGIGQCANSEGQYIAGFAVDAWDRCGLNNGAPCLPQHGGYSGGSDPTYPGYNPIYDNEFGCYMCTFNIQPACSTDNFAIRPQQFNLGMSDTDAPNLLRAGNDYNVSLTALDATNTVADSYTITDHNFNNDLDTNTTRYFKDGTVDTGNLLHGTSSVNTAAASYMLNGLSSLSDTIQPLTAQEIVGVSYDDVGLVGLNVYDKNWAAVDNDDTPMDCNSTTHTYICGDLNVTFIPHHFNVENVHLRDHKDGNYTYLSNDLNMSAHIDANISARNADDGITFNFRQGNLYYENPVSVDLNITEWLGVATRHLKGNSTHKHDIPTETLLGFGGSDENGTHNIPWNESNATQQLMFNYTRENDQTVNPFSVAGTDINTTVQSTYTDVSTPSSPAIIAGSGIADRNATFYFGRAKSSKFFYDNISASSVNTPISVVVYCDTFPNCNELTEDMKIFGKINEANWWLSLEHVETTGDGNITLQTGTITPATGTASVTTDVTVLTNATDTNIVVTNTNGTVPMLVEIDLDTTPTTDTNSWLIYNTNSPTLNPDPFYKVRFIGQSGWAGHGKTGHVVDSNASKDINKRLSW